MNFCLSSSERKFQELHKERKKIKKTLLFSNLNLINFHLPGKVFLFILQKKFSQQNISTSTSILWVALIQTVPFLCFRTKKVK